MTDLNLNEEPAKASELSEPVNSEQDEQELWASPGQELMNLREELGYSREEVSQALYITTDYVRALENDNYAKLPGHTFIKGYYKAYAEFIGGDAEQVLNSYLKNIEHSDQSKQEADAVESSNRNKAVLWGVAVVFLLIVLGGAFWMMNDANAFPLPVSIGIEV
jgi:cytoskeleton protein RodZ